MTSPAFEAFLARVYVDPAARAQFLADPRGSAVRAGLSEAESDALARVDRLGLELAAHSFARKRARRSPRRWRWLAALRAAGRRVENASEAYRRLDADRVIDTAERLLRRIGERFANSGLSGVSETLLAVARDAKDNSEAMVQPLLWLRLVVGIAIGTMAIAAFWAAFSIALKNAPSSWTDFAQGIDATLNVFILIGGSIAFLVTLETRIRRRRALGALSQLRALAHVVEMHQLTKDPERVLFPGRNTPSSPVLDMSVFELSRYLDYCSDMLAVISNVTALYAQGCEDAVALDAVDAIERLTTGIGQKIWQKLTIINSMTAGSSVVTPP